MNRYEEELLQMYKKSLGEGQEFRGIVCPALQKKPCRLCELCKEVLFNRSIPKEAPLRKKASSLNAKQHYFSNILFLADPTEVRVLEYGDKIFKQLLAFQMNPIKGAVDFWHPVAGRWCVIDRVQGATRDQVDYYVNARDPTKLTDMSVLGKMYNLGKIIDLVKEGTVKPIYQSKLEKTVVVRFLPSWLGPEYALKFFEKVDYHYNISEEDFRACQAGEINPIRIDGETEVKRETGVGVDMVESAARAGGWGTATDPRTPQTTSQWSEFDSPTPIKEIPKKEMPILEDEDESLPPCYGEYDQSDPNCSTTKCPEWSIGCKSYRIEKLEKRKTAKRLLK